MLDTFLHEQYAFSEGRNQGDVGPYAIRPLPAATTKVEMTDIVFQNGKVL